MQLWEGGLKDFTEEIGSGLLYSKMSGRWVSFHDSPPGTSEFRSWQNSLPAVELVIRDLPKNDMGLAVEYHFPFSRKRLDVCLFGKSPENGNHAVVIELKQWDSCELYDDYNENLNVKVGGEAKQHPSEQAYDYVESLNDFHSAFTMHDLRGVSCSFLHNYRDIKNSPIYDSRFNKILQASPAFGMGDADAFLEYIAKYVGDGEGKTALKNFTGGYFKPSKRVVDSLKETLAGNENWHLIDEQRIAYNEIMAAIKRAYRAKTKTVFVVRGAPGTGKSVVAVQLLKDTLSLDWKSLYFTPGQGFRVNLHAAFKSAAKLIVSPASISKFQDDELDLAIVDETHRIAENRTPYMPLQRGTTPIPQLIVDKSKVTVFFIDDRQRLRPLEVGNTEYLKDMVASRGLKIHALDLETQFRCNGSLGYIQWVDEVLCTCGIKPLKWTNKYEVKLMDTPADLEKAILKHHQSGLSARMVAGFCWPWSDAEEGKPLENDVVIGDWAKPWNRKKENKRAYRPDNDPYTRWANCEEGVGQIGCTYSSQGLEFDYVGVIWGKDLVRRGDSWIVNRDQIFDGPIKRIRDDKEILTLLGNAYRVLMTRGMKATYLYCHDDETRDYIAAMLNAAECDTKAVVLPFRHVAPPKRSTDYNTRVALVSLKVAASKFSGEQSSWDAMTVWADDWVSYETKTKIERGMFVAQVQGNSMEPTIPSGSYCLFRPPRPGRFPDVPQRRPRTFDDRWLSHGRSTHGQAGAEDPR